MEHSNDPSPLSPIQQCVANALAAGSTFTGAAEAYGVHRVTIYRWMKTCQPFSAALHRARADFVLACRDDLHHLSNRALETLLAILDNPKASPAVLLRTATFILQRPQLPKTGWSMPEPAPDPDGEKLLDSAIIEQDYDSLPGLCNIERDMQTDAPAETPPETEAPAESRASEPAPSPESPVSHPSNGSSCNQMQHDSQNCDDVAPRRPARVEQALGVPEFPHSVNRPMEGGLQPSYYRVLDNAEYNAVGCGYATVTTAVLDISSAPIGLHATSR